MRAIAIRALEVMTMTTNKNSFMYLQGLKTVCLTMVEASSYTVELERDGRQKIFAPLETMLTHHAIAEAYVMGPQHQEGTLLGCCYLVSLRRIDVAIRNVWAKRARGNAPENITLGKF